MGREYVTALSQSLEKKLKVLEEIYRLCKLQTEVLNTQPMDFERFDGLVDDKDICLEKLEKLDEGFELVYERVSRELSANRAEYTDQIKKMQELIALITEKSTSIEALEKRNKQSMSDMFVRERKELSEGKRSVSIAMNYYKNMAGQNIPDSKFMDQKK